MALLKPIFGEKMQHKYSIHSVTLPDFLVGKYTMLTHENRSCAFYEETLGLNRFNWFLKYVGVKNYLDDSKPEFVDNSYIYLQKYKIGGLYLFDDKNNQSNPYFIIDLAIHPPFEKFDLDYSLLYYPMGFKNGKYHWVIYSFEQGKTLVVKYNLYKNIWEKFGFTNDKKKYPNLVFD